MILAKLAIGAASTLVFAMVYTFREGTAVRVDVDEHRDGGAHVHVWAPAWRSSAHGAPLRSRTTSSSTSAITWKSGHR